MADSSIAISGMPKCYSSDSSTDQCSGSFSDDITASDGLNQCCGAGRAIRDDVLNRYYSLNGVVDCEACELFKYLATNSILLAVFS